MFDYLIISSSTVDVRRICSQFNQKNKSILLLLLFEKLRRRHFVLRTDTQTLKLFILIPIPTGNRIVTMHVGDKEFPIIFVS